MRHKIPRCLTILVIALLPFLLGASPPIEAGHYSQSQRDVIIVVKRAGAQFVRFVGIYDFFAPSLGCRENETAYRVETRYRGRTFYVDFCVSSGEFGAVRQARRR